MPRSERGEGEGWSLVQWLVPEHKQNGESPDGIPHETRQTGWPTAYSVFFGCGARQMLSLCAVSFPASSE